VYASLVVGNRNVARAWKAGFWEVIAWAAAEVQRLQRVPR